MSEIVNPRKVHGLGSGRADYTLLGAAVVLAGWESRPEQILSNAADPATIARYEAAIV
jgi:hypothetical protein